MRPMRSRMKRREEEEEIMGRAESRRGQGWRRKEAEQRGGQPGWDTSSPTQELLPLSPPAQRRSQEVRGHIRKVSSGPIAGDGELKELVTAPLLR